MRRKTLLALTVAVSVASGITFALVPPTAVRAPRAALGPGGLAAARFTDTSIAGIVPFPWLCSPVVPGGLPVVYLALFLAGIAVSIGRPSGLTSRLGRGIAVLCLPLAVGLGRFRLNEPAASCVSSLSGAMCSMGCALPPR